MGATCCQPAPPLHFAAARGHTLPVLAAVPLHTALTLHEFEDVFGEAIYYGAQLVTRASGGRQEQEQRQVALPPTAEAGAQPHPKDEARARAAAAAERARRYAQEGYFCT